MLQKSSRGVQQHEVAAAADALLAEGLRPTVERVRLKLGRGSPNTVAPMLEAWFAGLAPRLGVVPREEGGRAGPPAAVREGLQQLWEQAVQLATTEAEAALSQEREAFARERAQLAEERAAVAGQMSSAQLRETLLQASLQTAREQAQELQRRLEQAQHLVEQRDRELAEARSSIAALVQQKDAAAREHAAQIQRAQGEREKIMERTGATERRLLEEVDRARQQAKHADKWVAESEARAAKERALFEEERQSATRRIHDLEVERAQLLERLAGAGAARARPRKAGTERKATRAPSRTSARRLA
jgi:chromosome segregation ATPase